MLRKRGEGGRRLQGKCKRVPRKLTVLSKNTFLTHARMHTCSIPLLKQTLLSRMQKHSFQSIDRKHTIYCFILFCSRLCPSTAGSNPPSESSNFLCPLLSLSILLPVAHNVISPTTFWSSHLSYALYLPLCAFNGPSIVFHAGNVSSSFPVRIGYVLDYVCHPGFVA